MKALSLLIILSFAVPTSTYANESCDIRGKGNKLYKVKKYKKAIDVYKIVQDVDKIGKEKCTDAVYATLGTIYRILGNKKLSSNSYKAAIYFKSSAKYNRAFALAVLCSKAGKCEKSKNFWNL